MILEIIQDSEDVAFCLFEGSVIQDAKDCGTHYEGLFCSSKGSYLIQIPKERCKVRGIKKE